MNNNRIKKITNSKDLAKIIDHSMLAPDALLEDVDKAYRDSIKYGFPVLALNPSSLKYCKKDIIIDVAIGFPFGQNTIEAKVFETKDSIQKGAGEIDYVLNIVELKAGHLNYIKEEMLRIKDISGELIVKVILETCYLTDDEKKKAVELAIETKLDFVKTSTGFAPKGAKREDILLFKSIAGNDIGIKAAGEMTSLDEVLEMVNAGATRIGTKYSVSIIEEARKKWGK